MKIAPAAVCADSRNAKKDGIDHVRVPVDYNVLEGEKLTADLGGAVYIEGIREIGEGFFEDIFMPAIEKAKKDDVPLYCGEYGASGSSKSSDLKA